MQLLGLAGSCRLMLLLFCIVFPLFELLNDGLHAVNKFAHGMHASTGQ